MKHHIALKFIAILLCACCLVTAVVSGIGAGVLAYLGLYGTTLEEFHSQVIRDDLWWVSQKLAGHRAAEELTDCPPELLKAFYQMDAIETVLKDGAWGYSLRDENGQVLEQLPYPPAATATEYTVVTRYPVVLAHIPTTGGAEPQEPTQATYPDDITKPVESLPTVATEPAQTEPQVTDYMYLEGFWYTDEATGIGYHTELAICEGPVYTVTIYMTPEAYVQDMGWEWELLRYGYMLRFQLIALAAGGLLLFAVTLVYLCCAAGRKPKSEEVRPGGLNRLPLDLYGLIAGGGCLLLAMGIVEITDFFYDDHSQFWLAILAIAAMALVIALLIVAFLFAFAAQVKMRGFYWLRHSLVGMAVILCWKLVKWLWGLLGKCCRWLGQKIPVGMTALAQAGTRAGSALWRWIKTLWGWVCRLCAALWKAFRALARGCGDLCGRGARWSWRVLKRFCTLLPLTWQWLLTACLMGLALLFAAFSHNEMALVIILCLCAGVVLYGAHAFGILLESTRRMSKGDLDTKVDDRLLLGGFADYASHLNDLAGVAVVAAQKQMRSERMKAELVTNVSHDIKTPLTSIINYVDLLQKAQSEEESRQYLEVLDRQSQRLKKLIEDLMEMSKASTGNLAVEIRRVDAVEAVNQALGEFADKLSAAQLTPVFRMPEEPVLMLADGRLAWRVLSNLLSNAVKYALPGTRLYVDLVKLNGNVLISLKNISREELNVSSEELMERFVRGDASRNTEGSGLGLNIARSLMELQKGQLQLLVDGDLFKATLVFPSV